MDSSILLLKRQVKLLGQPESFVPGSLDRRIRLVHGDYAGPTGERDQNLQSESTGDEVFGFEGGVH